MKQLMFISLLVIPFCEAAAPLGSWNKALDESYPDVQGRPMLTKIDLANKGITDIPEWPEDLNFDKLKELILSGNRIGFINPYILEKLPKLKFLDVTGNTLLERNVTRLKEEAKKHPNKPMIRAYADDPVYKAPTTRSKKSAKEDAAADPLEDI